MKLVFDPSYPPEQLTAEFWEMELLLAQAEEMLRRMEEDRVEPG